MPPLKLHKSQATRHHRVFMVMETFTTDLASMENMYVTPMGALINMLNSSDPRPPFQRVQARPLYQGGLARRP